MHNDNNGYNPNVDSWDTPAQPEETNIAEEEFIEDTQYVDEETETVDVETLPEQGNDSDQEESAEPLKGEELVIDQAVVNFETLRDVAKRNGAELKPSDYKLAFILENPKTVTAILDRYDDFLKKLGSEQFVPKKEDVSWYESLVLGLHYTNNTDCPIGATEREGSKWTQGIYGNDKSILLRPGRPAQRIEKNKRYTKEELITYLSRKSGGGGTYDAFLPTSGLWLRLREPSLAEVVAMLTEIDQTTVKVGMQTKGLMFSNASAVPANAVTALALSCVISANVNFTTPTDLEELISVLDEPILQHALAAVMHPEGFDYKVPCIADIANCSATIEFKAIMSSIVWYDNLAFTSEQRKLASRRFARPSTKEEILAYKEQFSIGNDKVFWFGDIGVKLSIPSVYQRRVYVDEWIEALTDMTSGAFNEAPDGPNRRAYIDRLNEATKAAQFGQWVKGIYERTEDAISEEDMMITDDPEIIKDFLSNVLSRENNIEKFFEAVTKFSNESILGIVALPSHQCPECNGSQGNVLNDRFPHLVPIEVLPVFFTLAGRKVQHLANQ